MLLFAGKRLLLNLLEFRFLGAVVVVLLLFGLTAINHKRAYQQEIMAVQQEQERWQGEVYQARVYRQVILSVSRQLSPLTTLVTGVSGRYGTVARLGGLFGVDTPDDPRPLKTQTFTQTNPLLANVLSLDFSHLVLLFISLLAIFLTYDVICGEREQGMLRLCWSHSVPRFRLFFGEYGGTLVTLLLPLAAMLLLWLIVSRIPPALSLERADYIRLGLIVGLTLLFLSGFVLLGLWVSALTRSSATSLALLLVIWAGLVIVYPLSLPTLVRARVAHEGRTSGAPFERWTPERGEALWHQNLRLYHSMERLVWLAPTTSYMVACQILAQSDVGAHIRFVAQARWQNQHLKGWQEDKLRLYPGRDSFFENTPLDLSDLPTPHYQPESLRESLDRALPFFVVLLLFNLIGCVGGLRAILTYSPTV